LPSRSWSELWFLAHRFASVICAALRNLRISIRVPKNL
jgi:hypothetical protein